MAQNENEVRVELELSGMPEEKIKVILEFDHRVELEERYYERNKDYGTENRKKPANVDFKDDPIDCIPDLKKDIYAEAFPERRELDPRIAKLLIAMKSLNEDQINLIYDMYGSGTSMEEIAQRDGVTRQAINNRKNKILRKLRKLMEE